jgi:hypothetical protein
MFKVGDRFYNRNTRGYGIIINVSPYEMPIMDEVTGSEYLHTTKAYQMKNIFDSSSSSWLLEDTVIHYLRNNTLELIREDFKPLKAINKFVF